tara:strand:- start:1006 stop:1518 length:513 start_codon:yes stop_codon:yes gene_type:complete
MKLKKNLVLLGMMGSGKSTIGYLLSKNLNLEFYDIDSIIEKQDGRKIAEIFNTEGEDFFRKLEEKVSIKILKLKNKVISLGGGAFLNENIRKEVLSNNVSFWLNWKDNTLINRIKRNNKRPIINNSNENEIKKLISKRLKIYSMADFKINCEKFTKNEITRKILDIYEKN